MKVASAEGEVSTNITDADEYEISHSAKMYEILYHSIYSDPIGAVVREIASNAFDSHVQAGCQDKPFRVILPNSFRPFFEVEDFGVGMSDADISRVYSGYGLSTKADTDDLVGGFGLGSKTPFAYGPIFNTRTRKDGVEAVYMNYIGDDGKPKIKKLSSAKTDQPNGVKISVPVEPKDFHKFYVSAAHYLSFYRVRPDVVANEFEFNVPEADVAALYKYGTGPITDRDGNQYIVMGSVPYPMHDAPINRSRSLVIPIGFLRPTASRENLDFTGAVNKLDAFAIEKFTAAKQSILAEFCSSRRAVAKLSAMRNTGAIRMLMHFVKDDIQTRQAYTSFLRLTKSGARSNASNIADTFVGAVSAVVAGNPITVLYGPATAFKRQVATRVECAVQRARNGVVVRLNERSDRYIPILKKVFPDGEIGVTWKSYDDVYKSRPRKARSTSVGSSHCVGMLVSSKTHEKADLANVDPAKCHIVFTKSWASAAARYSARFIMNMDSSGKDHVILINPTKANLIAFKARPDVHPVTLEDWKITIDRSILLAYFENTLGNATATLTKEWFDTLMPILNTAPKGEPLDQTVFDGIKRTFECARDKYIRDRMWQFRTTFQSVVNHVENYETVRDEVHAMAARFESWYNAKVKAYPMLKYVGNLTNTAVVRDIQNYVNS